MGFVVHFVAQAGMKQTLVQILVEVAIRIMGSYSAEVEKGSAGSALQSGLADPKPVRKRIQKSHA